MNRILSVALCALFLAACAGLPRSAPNTLSLEVAGFVQAELPSRQSSPSEPTGSKGLNSFRATA